MRGAIKGDEGRNQTLSSWVWKRITGIRSVATVTSVEMMSRLNETHWPVRNWLSCARVLVVTSARACDSKRFVAPKARMVVTPASVSENCERRWAR